MPDPPHPLVASGTPFVGREREQRVLAEAWADARAGHTRLVLVAGEPGTGKTALAERMAATARTQGANVFWGRCWEGGGAPAYWAWVQVLRGCERVLASPGAAARTAPVADIIQLLPGMTPLRDEGAASAVPKDEHARFALFDAVAAVLRATADAQPLVVFLEDLHAADVPTVLLLQFVARHVMDARLLIVGTYRDAQATLRKGAGDRLAELEGSSRRLVLEGLSPAELHELLRRVYDASVSPAFVSRLHRITRGNPYFVLETMNSVLARCQDLGLSIIGEPQLPLAISVRALVEDRLATLTRDERSLLALASVLGQEFSLHALRPLAARIAPDADRILAGPSLRPFVVPLAGVAGRFRFAHALVREAVRDALAPEERARLHREVAETLEHNADPPSDERTADLAHHWYYAARAADPADSSVLDRALHWAREAARCAAARLAYEEAALHYERALIAHRQNRGASERDRCDLLIALGRMLNPAGETHLARATFVEAAEIARRLGMSERLAEAALGLGAIASSLEAGHVDRDLLALLEDALRILPGDESPLRALVTARLVYEVQLVWPWNRVRGLALEAVRIATRSDAPATLGYVLLWAGQGLGWRDLDARLEQGEKMVALSRVSGLPEVGIVGHMRRARAFLEAGRIASADTETATLEALVERSRWVSHRWWLDLWRAMRACARGEFELAERYADVARDIGRPTHPVAADVAHLTQRTFIRWQQGEVSETARVVQQLSTTVEHNYIRCALAWISSENGDSRQAAAILEEQAAGGFARVEENQGELLSLICLAATCGSLGHVEWAAHLYDRLMPFAARCVYQGVAMNYFGTSSLYLGGLATTLGRWADAERHFAAAKRLDAALGARPWLARTLHAWVVLLQRRGAPGDLARARTLTQEALEIARSLGMRDLERRLVALETESRARASAAPAGTGPALRNARASAPNGARAKGRCAFRREGDYWTIGESSRVVRVRHTKGMEDLAHLLVQPGRDTHVLDLVARLAAPLTIGAPWPGATIAGRLPGTVDDEPIDVRARDAYRERLIELRDDLADAERCNDSARALRDRHEIEAISTVLVSAYRGGRRRIAGEPLEKARKAVAWRLRHAIAHIERLHPEIGRHLRESIKLGTLCRYVPNAEFSWEIAV